jgi:cell division transport system ATP-binding protein
MVRLQNVFKTYKNRIPALVDVNLEIEEGESVSIFGTNGAGKSTLIKLIVGAELPSRGQIFLQGKNTKEMSRRYLLRMRQRMGIVFQTPNLLYRRTVLENISLPLLMAGFPAREIKTRTIKVLNSLNLAAKRSTPAHKLSSGERKLVSIARAIIHEPSILLVDEPVDNFDQKTASSIISLLLEMHTKGTTLIVTTRSEGVVEELQNRVIHLDKGRLVDV